MYGGEVYASSHQRRRNARFPCIALSRFGTQPWNHESPVDTEQLCMLLQSFGVSQMKFVPASSAEITSLEDPGRRFAHLEAFPVIVVYDRNG